MNINRIGGKIADKVDAVTDWLIDATTAVLLWFALVWVPWKDVRSDMASGNRDAFEDGEYEADQAEFLFELGRQAADHTDDKAKHLLSLSLALAALVVVFAPEVSPEWLTFGPAVPLLPSVLLCIRQLGVRTEMVPIPDRTIEGTDNAKWGFDVLRAYKHNEKARLFLVNLYAASRRWLTVAVVMISIVAVRRSPAPDATAAELAAIRALLRGHEASRVAEFEHWQAAFDSLLSIMRRDTLGPIPRSN